MKNIYIKCVHGIDDDTVPYSTQNRIGIEQSAQNGNECVLFCLARCLFLLLLFILFFVERDTHTRHTTHAVVPIYSSYISSICSDSVQREKKCPVSTQEPSCHVKHFEVGEKKTAERTRTEERTNKIKTEKRAKRGPAQKFKPTD